MRASFAPVSHIHSIRTAIVYMVLLITSNRIHSVFGWRFLSRVTPGVARRSSSSSLSATRRSYSNSDHPHNNNNMPNWETLTSTKSNTIKLFSSLLSKRKKRNELQSTVLEGYRLVYDTLKDPKTSQFIQHVVVSQHHMDGISQFDRKDEDEDASLENKFQSLLEQRCEEHGIRVNIGTQEVVNACCDTVTPQGVVATCSIPPPPSPSQSQSPNKPPLYLVLDGVSDPGNAGTLLRSGLAVGVSGVLLLPNCVDVWSPKAVRSAMGSTFQLPIYTFGTLDSCLGFLNDQNVRKERFFAATMDTNMKTSSTSSPAHYDIDWIDTKSGGGGAALCIGKEGPGLSKEVRAYVSRGEINSVHVPMEVGIESLNAAVCGSVIMFEYSRQCRIAAKAAMVEEQQS